MNPTETKQKGTPMPEVIPVRFGYAATPTVTPGAKTGETQSPAMELAERLGHIRPKPALNPPTP